MTVVLQAWSLSWPGDAATLVELPHDELYAQSVQAIQALAREALADPPTAPPYDQCARALTAVRDVRSATIAWFNQIYPACVSIVSVVIDRQTAIGDGLSLLSQVSAQLRDDPTNRQLQQAVADASTTLMAGVTGPGDEIARLAQSLTQFRSALTAPVDALTDSLGPLLQVHAELEWRLNSDLAALHSEENAICPNAGAVARARAAVDRDVADGRAVDDFARAIGGLANAAPAASNGVAYVETTWTTVATMASRIVSLLDKISKDPPEALDVDIDAAQQGWEKFLESIESLRDGVEQ